MRSRRNSLTALLAFLLLAPSLRAAPAAGAFSDAAKRYDAGDYRGAAALYEELISAQPRDAGLRYNLGNALFKEGKVGRAIAQYQRAFDIKPRDADIRYNFEFALKKAGEELVPPGVPPALFAVFYLFSERELAGIHWLACWAALLLAGVYLLKEPLRPALSSWCLAALASWGLAGGWWLARRGLDPVEGGVIVSSTAEIRSGPGEKFNVSFTAPEGRRVQILSENGDWLEIGVLKEGAKGWLAAQSVEKL